MSRRPGGMLTCSPGEENGLRAVKKGEWQRAEMEKAKRGQKACWFGLSSKSHRES